MKNLHNINPGPSDEIKLLVARWHIDHPSNLNRRYGKTKWENSKLYYKSPTSLYWKEVNDETTSFIIISKDRKDIGLECFNPDMLNMK